MRRTPRHQWPYPSYRTEPWDDAFVSMLGAIDATVYTCREDRNLVLTGGGSVAFNATSGVLSWSADLLLNAATTGFTWTLPAGSVTVPDGSMVGVSLTRNPTNNITLVATVVAALPSTDDALMLCIRRGSRIHFRDGQVLNDGDVVDVFEATTGGSLKNVLVEGNTTDGTDIEISSGDRVISGVNVPLTIQTEDDPADVGAGDLTLKAGDSEDGSPGSVIIRSGSSGSLGYGAGSITLRVGTGDDVSGINLLGAPVYCDCNLTAVLGLNTDGDVYADGLLRGARLEVAPPSLPVGTPGVGTIFVSDGTGGLNNQKLYYRFGTGTPIELGAGDPFLEKTIALNEECDGFVSSKALGAFEFDPDDYYGGTNTHVQLRVVMACSNPGETATFKLYNLTDAEFVTAAEVSTSSSTPVLLTATLSVGAAPYLRNASTLYEARIYQSGPLGTDATYLGSAVFRVLKGP